MQNLKYFLDLAVRGRRNLQYLTFWPSCWPVARMSSAVSLMGEDMKMILGVSSIVPSATVKG